MLKTQRKPIGAQDISNLLVSYFPNLIVAFYEMQSSFLSGIYKRNDSIESAIIKLCFLKGIHLKILRKREQNLDYNISLSKMLDNINCIENPNQKIISIVNLTAFPKETARRKMKSLVKKGFLIHDKKNRDYYFNFVNKNKNLYTKEFDQEVKVLSKFVSVCSNCLNLNLNKNTIEDEIKMQFSFYWYHFLSCQLDWLKMWQEKIKDLDLILIVLQAIIKNLEWSEKKYNAKSINLDNIHTIIGKYNEPEVQNKHSAISATSISEISGIPRATCIRKLKKLVKLGLLTKDESSKGFFINQITSARTKNILTKENINNTIKVFSEYISIMLNAVNRKNQI